MTVLGLHHVEVAGPPGCEDDARAFYGGVLGLEELLKPEPLHARGGCWFRAGANELHVGIEDPFVPARKAHPALVVSDLDWMRSRLVADGILYEDDWLIEGLDRLYTHDPFGNRLEIRQAV
jgi:catechol 2,3-dioxygenase-like lactoylglutathione lyase family enzyme